jgi:tetratricopeptide (TPR) repeat protein
MAIYDYNRATELDHNLEESYRNRAACYIKLKDYRQAILDSGKAINLAQHILILQQLILIMERLINY